MNSRFLPISRKELRTSNILAACIISTLSLGPILLALLFSSNANADKFEENPCDCAYIKLKKMD